MYCIAVAIGENTCAMFNSKEIKVAALTVVNLCLIGGQGWIQGVVG